MPGTGDLVTVWPGFWRLSTLIPVVILAAVFIVGALGEFAAGQPVEAVAALIAPVVILLSGWVTDRFRPRLTRLEVTESVVRARQGRWRGQPDLQVPRHQVRAICYFPGLISFRDPDNRPIMAIAPHYTLRQMRKVAAELDVRLYDHRRWLGLRKATAGRLAYDPASGPGPSGNGPGQARGPALVEAQAAAVHDG